MNRRVVSGVDSAIAWRAASVLLGFPSTPQRIRLKCTGFRLLPLDVRSLTEEWALRQVPKVGSGTLVKVARSSPLPGGREMRREWIAPLTGVAFVVFLVIGFIVGGEPPEAKDSTAQEVVQHYIDHKDATIAGAFLASLAALFLVFF